MSDIFDNESEFKSVLAINNYSDFDFSMKQNPNYKDILPITGSNAIKRAVHNLITISRYDRVFNNKLSVGIDDFIMDKNNPITNAVIIEEIKSILDKHEPRIDNVEVETRSQNNHIRITIYFTIVNVQREDSVDIVFFRNR